MTVNEEKYDAIIIGGGPCGSTLGQLLAKQGKKVAIVEKSTFPRFHVGESLLPATTPLLHELGLKTFLEEKSVKKPGGLWVYGYKKNGSELTTGARLLIVQQVPHLKKIHLLIWSNALILMPSC